MKKIYVGDIVSRAWDLAVKHWPIFVLLSLVSSLGSNFGYSFDKDILRGLGQNPDPQAVAEAISQSMQFSPWIILGVLLSLYIGFITFRMLYNAATTGKPYENFGDALKIDINQFAIFFCVELAVGIIVGVGTLFCVLPGIFLGVRLLFAPMIAAVENVGFGEALSRSWNMTSGSFWDLFLLGLTAIGICILGFCACCVGLYFADVVVNFMLMLAYLVLRSYLPSAAPAAEPFNPAAPAAPEAPAAPAAPEAPAAPAENSDYQEVQ